MSKADRMHKLSLERKGKTHIESYQKKTNFNSPGTKRAGDHKYADYPGKPGYNPEYSGGTDSSAEGNIPE
jgi:hypothetical protein